MLVGLIFLGIIAGSVSALAALLTGSGIGHALFLYAAVGSATVLTLAVAIQISAILRALITPREAIAAASRARG